ncbi:FecR family protein [Paracnuella aquatica]|uniref:FecR family protein n=1 Tax=Paracnuella aquatica TaxID=2268757 RepID=UPI000DEEF1C9|nr:FecR family protein [Paracnuella aquatica]RPD47303.1 FecR family protein [Paracnuella aquatica]
MIPDHISKLAEKFLRGEATEAEKAELHQWYDSADGADTEVVITEQPITVDELGEQAFAEIQAQIAATKQAGPTGRVIPLFRWPRLAVAAAVLLLAGTGIFYWLSNQEQPTIASTPKSVQTDLLPGTNAATLTLADGSTVLLDSTANGATLQQGGSKIIKLADGRLAYNSAGAAGNAVLYNTLATPRGGQYQLTLPDGSLVWLNAASSLKYPTAFTGAERLVELTGEAYFEVVKNGAQPFVVAAADNRVVVHGTHFNVNAYSDEGEMRTSLLEGSVSVTNPSAKARLVPGQQASVGKNDATIDVATADVEQAVAWKNGYFSFDNADLKTVMRQVARWYDVEVVYEGTPTGDRFSGEVPRNSKATELLKILELSNIRFRIEGKKIVVMQ